MIIEMPIELRSRPRATDRRRGNDLTSPCRSPRTGSSRSSKIRPSNRTVMHHGGRLRPSTFPEGVTREGRTRVRAPTARNWRRASAAPTRQPVQSGSSTKPAIAGSDQGRSRSCPGRGLRAAPSTASASGFAAGRVHPVRNMHYQPSGKPEKDRTKLGIWFTEVPSRTKC